MAGDQPIRVGVPLVGGRGGNWAAGAIYTHNLVRAVASAHLHDELSVVLLAPGYLGSISRLSGLSAGDALFFSHTSSDSPAKKITRAGLSLVKSRTVCLFETRVAQHRLDALYPAGSYHGERLAGVAQISWVPDFQHLHLPEFYPKGELQSRKASIAKSVEEARFLIVSSQDAYRDVEQHFPAALGRTRALPFAMVPHDAWFAEPPVPAAGKRLGFHDYVIFPSQFWKHKNHKTLFEAIRILRDRGRREIRLVCTGHMDDSRNPGHAERLIQWIRDHTLESQIITTGLLDRYEQIQLVRQARGVIQPSLFEGWSALLEDSQMMGKPALASDIPVHREQSPPDVAFFPALDADSLAGRIELLWDRHQTGWDEACEQAARLRQHDRVADFARRFSRVVRGFLQPPT